MNDREKMWRGLQAASLSIVAGMGHLFLGEKKGYLYLAFGISLILISWFLWKPAELLYFSFVIFSAVDAFSIAKRGHGLM
jgi:hypothetical protein